MYPFSFYGFAVAALFLSTASGFSAAPSKTQMDLAKATVVVRSGEIPIGEKTAAQVLVEEVKTRTGISLKISTTWPKSGVAIAIVSGSANPDWPKTYPQRSESGLPESRPEGFRLVAKPGALWVHGADGRGTLFAVGQLLLSADWKRGSITISSDFDIATAPSQPIRGHQLGYRAAANSYDGWDEKQYERYIRELALFGANSIESIPFQDDRKSPHMPVSREIMDRKISEICSRYDLDYWIWAPADYDLKNSAKRAAALAQHEKFFRDCPRLDAVFFPGGDPGDNAPEQVIPYLDELSHLLAKYHPRAKIWLSMQGFEKPQVKAVHAWINEKLPDWLGGLVAGPSSPPIPETRALLPQRYGLRDYPDITHQVRSQFPVIWWDQAFALTLGRESVNPRTTFFKTIHNYYAPYTLGFISYSDGIHDDVNKTVWSLLGWNNDFTPREMLVQYTRCFFGSTVAERAADGILALEKNWEGPLAENGGVDATFALWEQLERVAPELRDNWRWQLCLLRAYYDAYTRHRLIYEMDLEREANLVLSRAAAIGSAEAMKNATTILKRATSQPVQKASRARIDKLCADLFKSIRLQTSVAKYQASGTERGAILDFVDYPLNNRWWLEDEFAQIAKLPSETDKLTALERIRTWEDPGPGSFYDEVGNIAKSPHVIRGEGLNTDPAMEKNTNPTFWWWDNGFSRKRLSWQTSMDWPIGLAYHNLDSKSSYRVRMTGFGSAKLRGNGQPLTQTVEGKEIGVIKEFAVPAGVIKEGRLNITFDPLHEEGLNWRQQSRVSEVWLLKD